MPYRYTRKGGAGSKKEPVKSIKKNNKTQKIQKTSGNNLSKAMTELSIVSVPASAKSINGKNFNFQKSAKPFSPGTVLQKKPLNKNAKEFIPPKKQVALRANAEEYIPKNPNNFSRLLPPVVAIDCEMVKVKDPTKSGLAEVAVVDWNGDVIYHKYVIPPSEITNYLTRITGITKEKLEREGVPFDVVQKELETILANKIIVGHALGNDIRAIGIPIPEERKWNSHDIPELMRNTPIKREPRKLKTLTLGLLGYPIQEGVHSAVIDAQASMGIYRWYANHTIFGTAPLSQEAYEQLSRLDELERLNKLSRAK